MVRHIRQALLLATLLSPAFSTPAAENAGFRLVEVADGVYVHQGVNVPFTDPRHDDIANIGFIVGDTCIAVIDTGGSVKIGEELRQAVHKTSQLPVCYVINTHVHVDHVLGNAAFLPDHPRFVGHANLPDAIAANREFFLKHYARDLGPHPSPKMIIAPDITVAKTRTLDLGNRVLRLRAWGPAHTYTDLTIFDERTRTLWAGDLVFLKRIPALDGSLNGWIKTVHELEKIKADLVIPGHGPASAPWPGAAQPELKYLDRLRSTVRKDIAEGKSMEEVIDNPPPNDGKWLLYQQHEQKNLTKAYTELEWE